MSLLSEYGLYVCLSYASVFVVLGISLLWAIKKS